VKSGAIPRLPLPDPKQSIARAEVRTPDRALENGQLLTQRHVLERHGSVSTTEQHERSKHNDKARPASTILSSNRSEHQPAGWRSGSGDHNLSDILGDEAFHAVAGDDIVLYLRALLNDKRGHNIRNHVMHRCDPCGVLQPPGLPSRASCRAASRRSPSWETRRATAIVDGGSLHSDECPSMPRLVHITFPAAPIGFGNAPLNTLLGWMAGRAPAVLLYEPQTPAWNS
jgi:hypothetical protein